MQIGTTRYANIYNGRSDVVKTKQIGSTTEESYLYDGFGVNKSSATYTIPNPYRYSGEYTDTETGKQYLRARYYDPSIGRFTQEDTYWGDGTNLYSYCHNNPVMFSDPSGQAIEYCYAKLKGYKKPIKVQAKKYTFPSNYKILNGFTRYFHTSVNLNYSPLNIIYKRIGDRIYNGSSYYLTALRGEYYLPTVSRNSTFNSSNYFRGLHEGIDYSASGNQNAKMYSLTKGTVLEAKNGEVAIYESFTNRTFIYYHVSNIQVKVGQYVSAKRYIGNQNSTDNHLHLEANSGRNYVKASDYDDVLTAIDVAEAYWVYWYYIGYYEDSIAL